MKKRIIFIMKTLYYEQINHYKLLMKGHTVLTNYYYLYLATRYHPSIENNKHFMPKPEKWQCMLVIRRRSIYSFFCFSVVPLNFILLFGDEITVQVTGVELLIKCFCYWGNLVSVRKPTTERDGFFGFICLTLTNRLITGI